MSQTVTIAMADNAQVRIRLSSNSPDVALPEDPGPILVSTDLRRYQLSTLVNRLLTTETPIPFDFLINGQFLRTSIDDFLTTNGISAETVLSLEYIRALIPPSHVASFQHDDWVSAIDVLSSTSTSRTFAGQDTIISASYDGLLRTWNAAGQCVSTSASASEAGHTGAIKACKFLSPTQVVSASVDRTLRIWSHNDKLTPTLELYGHTASVDRLAVDQTSSKILSASADHTVGLWSSSKSGSPAAPDNLVSAPSSKRRKLTPGPSVSIPQRGCLALLTGHGAQVSDVIFKPDDATVAYSTSWDHTLKTWDLPTRTCVQTRTTAHALLCTAAMPHVNLVAAGTSARHVTLIDPRASAANVVAMTLRGHVNAVSCLAASPENGYVLASGSHDGTVRVWDARSVKPGAAGIGTEGGAVGESMYVLDRDGMTGKLPVGGEGVKVFGLCWDSTWGIVSAGQDKKVQINREEKR